MIVIRNTLDALLIGFRRGFWSLLGISVEELGGVKEVIDALSEIEGFKDVVRVQKRKRKERGGFDGRVLLTGVIETVKE